MRIDQRRGSVGADLMLCYSGTRAQRVDPESRTPSTEPVVLDSGLAASRRPGMTMRISSRPWRRRARR
jgi:hypothetical protein